MNKEEMFYEVVKPLGCFSGNNEQQKKYNYTKEINLLSWKGRTPTFDIRAWRMGNDGIKHPLKGMALSKNELLTLRDLLNSIDFDSLGV